MGNTSEMQDVRNLVDKLPEIYQPIFGHPELSKTARRPSDDRLEMILHIYGKMSAYLKRPLKVLDVGCAQGFFSLNLAKHGATVTGIDFQEENINLCKELARTSGLDVNFVRTDAKEFLEQEKLGYDLILGFSIFHHVINRDGIDVVRKILEKLARDGASLLLEMALKTEPLAWARAQPADQRQFLSGIGFVHEMKTHATHLSKISRPTFFCSDKFVLLNEFLMPSTG